MRTIKFLAIVTIEVEIVRLAKVRAYKRIRNGKIEKVRSYYRRYLRLISALPLVFFMRCGAFGTAKTFYVAPNNHFE